MHVKRTIRFRSSCKVFGYPLLVVSCGPDSTSGELRGSAKGIIAIGDIAIGVVAIGGITAGLVSIGGLSIGLITIGGVAVGGLVLGGVAVGVFALGGVAIGYYAAGGKAVGAYVIHATQRDPQAVNFFRHFIPWISPKT